MKKSLALLLSFTTHLCSQELSPFRLYGEFGYGFSRTAYSGASGGFGINLAVTAGYDTWRMKYARRVNNEASLVAPQEKINANSLLFGHSFVLHRVANKENDISEEWNVTAYIGYSSIENQRRGNVINSPSFGTTYEHIIEHGGGIPVELEVQYVIPHFNAVAVSVFCNVNGFRNFYGVNLMVFGGYF